MANLHAGIHDWFECQICIAPLVFLTHSIVCLPVRLTSWRPLRLKQPPSRLRLRGGELSNMNYVKLSFCPARARSQPWFICAHAQHTRGDFFVCCRSSRSVFPPLTAEEYLSHFIYLHVFKLLQWKAFQAFCRTSSAACHSALLGLLKNKALGPW